MADPVVGRLRELLVSGAGNLPRPGGGNTLGRWRALAAVAAEDLALVKLFEGHADALAIIGELAGPAPAPGSTWATWAAEPPSARVLLRQARGTARLSGRKAWCSGAGAVSDAVLTAWDEHGRQCLAMVRLDQVGVRITAEGWHAVGMGRVDSGDVLFDDVPATMLGRPGDYLNRPGFWHGGAGIAACWYGGLVPLAEELARRVAGGEDPHASAHLGAVDAALGGARAALRAAARWIDDNPQRDAEALALRVRGIVEEAVAAVLHHAGRALGAGPLCRDPALAQRFADLPVFVRQSHAERDLAVLGDLVAKELVGQPSEAAGWAL
ncbi:MAG TPA: hypothetical protein VJ851_10235 [Jatrophihabitans sp.]|nr:hypothetical protein [Jatrophihabitans sp.]